MDLELLLDKTPSFEARTRFPCKYEKRPIGTQQKIFMEQIKTFAQRVTPNKHLRDMLAYRTIPIDEIAECLKEAKTHLAHYAQRLANNPKINNVTVELKPQGAHHLAPYSLALRRTAGAYAGEFVTPPYDTDTKPICLFTFEYPKK